jgi:hypothetical protein
MSAKKQATDDRPRLRPQEPSLQQCQGEGRRSLDARVGWAPRGGVEAAGSIEGEGGHVGPVGSMNSALRLLRSHFTITGEVTHGTEI